MNFKKFLNNFEKEILSKDFEKSLNEAKKIDSKYSEKAIIKEDIIKIIDEYKNVDEKSQQIKNIQFLTYGNPEIVLRLAIETLRNYTNSTIIIDDFCLAQNTVIIKYIETILKNIRLGSNIKLKNLASVNEIIENSKNVDKTICVGNSNQYNLIVDKAVNVQFYPYNVFMLYSDSDEFDELKKSIYDYASLNGYEMEILNTELDFNDVIDIMNTDSYNFATVLLSKDEEKIEKFKKLISSKYKIINENPFYQTQFQLDI